MVKRRSLRKTRRRVKKGGMMEPMEHDGANMDGENSPGTDEMKMDMEGGKKRKTLKKGGKKKRKSRKGKKMNEFFRLLIDAKKKNAESFVYKGKKYKRKVGTKKNPKLVVYKKA